MMFLDFARMFCGGPTQEAVETFCSVECPDPVVRDAKTLSQLKCGDRPRSLCPPRREGKKRGVFETQYEACASRAKLLQMLGYPPEVIAAMLLSTPYLTGALRGLKKVDRKTAALLADVRLPRRICQPSELGPWLKHQGGNCEEVDALSVLLLADFFAWRGVVNLLFGANQHFMPELRIPPKGYEKIWADEVQGYDYAVADACARYPNKRMRTLEICYWVGRWNFLVQQRYWDRAASEPNNHGMIGFELGLMLRMEVLDALDETTAQSFTRRAAWAQRVAADQG